VRHNKPFVGSLSMSRGLAELQRFMQ
jgi:hypothetical protein